MQNEPEIQQPDGSKTEMVPGGGITEREIHLRKRSKPFKRTEPPLGDVLLEQGIHLEQERRLQVTMMKRYFAIDMPAVRFLRNTLVFSLLSLIPAVIIYIVLTPGFGGMLIGGGLPLGRFLRQVATNGLPVVFVVNYVSFFLFASTAAKPNRNYGIRLVLLVDLPVRVFGFIALHAVIYVLSADLFGSFGGSRATALRVVAPTLVRSILFENISGAYLYATLASALPLYVTAIENSVILGGLANRLPGRSGPVLLAVALFAFSVLALTAVAAMLIWWQTF